MSQDMLNFCNIALAKLGFENITSINDDNLQSITANNIYPLAKEALLSSHSWSFATIDTQLTQAGTHNGAYLYDLPSDMLRIIKAFQSGNANSINYQIRGPQITCEVKDIHLQYIALVGESQFPAYFKTALIERLAADFCLPLLDNSSRSVALYKTAEAELLKAKIIDNYQTAPQSLTSNILLGGRQ